MVLIDVIEVQIVLVHEFLVVEVDVVESVDDDEESEFLAANLALREDQSVWESIVVVVGVKVHVLHGQNVIIVVVKVLLVVVSSENVLSVLAELLEHAHGELLANDVLEVA